MVFDYFVDPLGEIGSATTVLSLGVEVEILTCGKRNDLVDVLLRNVFDVEVLKDLFEFFVHEQDSGVGPAEVFFFALEKNKNTFHKINTILWWSWNEVKLLNFI